MRDKPDMRSVKIGEFMEELELLVDNSDESLFHDGHLQLNNNRWYVSLVHTEEEAGHVKGTLLSLLRQRRELVVNVLLAEETDEFLDAVAHLSGWLHPRGFRVALQGKSLWAKLQLWWFGVRGIVGAE